MGDGKNQFIYDAIINNCIDVATHKHGCCVIQRCLDHANQAQKTALIEVIVKNTLALVSDKFGNYVVQYVFDLSDINSDIYGQIAEKLCDSIIELSK